MTCCLLQEEYVPQLSNMEKTTGYDELEQSLISITGGEYQQQQPSSSTHVFAKPSPWVHGGKRMQIAVKNISRNDRPPTAATDDEHSDRGEEVQSPVAPTDIRDNNRGSGHLRGLPRRLPNDRGRPKKRRSKSKSKSRSQSSSRSPTATRPRESPEKRGNKDARRRGSNPTPRPAEKKGDGTRPQHPPTRPQPSPPKTHEVTEGLNNELYKAMRQKMPESASRAASLVSGISSVSTSKRRSPAPFVLGDCVPKQLQGKEVCTKTISAIQTLRNVKRRNLIEAVRLIVHVAPSPPGGQNQQQQQPPLPPNYPSFDHYSYLFSGQEECFGYDYQTLRNNPALVVKSLTHALKPGPKRDPKNMSLDLVFRRALREIAQELYDIADPGTVVVSLENPVFVSGRYLELRVLQKLVEFYSVHCAGLDLSKYLTQSSADTTSPLREYVEGSRCEQYVRVLHDRYLLKSGADLVNPSPESLPMPSSMRVWTDVETQESTSLRIYNYTETLFEEVKRESEVNVGLAMKFGHAYGKEMARFIREHQEFFARALKASELFVWMCFGITTDEVFQGNGIMAASYALASAESKNPNICWNYPLATMIRARPENVAAPPPLVAYDEYFSENLEEDFAMVK
ncbi:hypothetical protein J6590_055945 [Homalodisca vitripennis]|nr:hypothetical protein J6590_055945 [Homalodisca vitripennis]